MTITTKANKMCENKIIEICLQCGAQYRFVEPMRLNRSYILGVFFAILTAIYFMNGSKIFDVSAFFGFIFLSFALHIKRWTRVCVFSMSYAALFLFSLFKECWHLCILPSTPISLTFWNFNAWNNKRYKHSDNFSRQNTNQFTTDSLYSHSHTVISNGFLVILFWCLLNRHRHSMVNIHWMARKKKCFHMPTISRENCRSVSLFVSVSLTTTTATTMKGNP